MRRKSKSILAIVMAAAMMSGSMSVSAADFTSEETSIAEETGSQQEELQTEDQETFEDFQEEVPEEEISEEPEEAEDVEIEEEAEVQSGEQQDSVDIGGSDEEDLFSAGDAAEGTQYNMWVGKIRVTDANKDDVLGDLDGDARTVTYDPAQKKLTLDNATVTGGIRILENNNSTLELKNQNRIIADSSKEWSEDSIGIFGNADSCTITGGGSLTITDGDDHFIDCNKKLIIDNVKFQFEMGKDYSGYDGGIRSTDTIEIRKKADINIQMNQANVAAISVITARPMSLDNETSVQTTEETGNIIISDSELNLQSTYSSVTTDKGSIKWSGSTAKLQGSIFVYGEGMISVDKSKLDIESQITAMEAVAGTIDIKNGSSVKTKSMGAQILGYGINILNSRLETIRDVEDGPSLESMGAINIMKSVVITESFADKYSIIAFDKEMQEEKTINIADSWVDSIGELQGRTLLSDCVLFTGQKGYAYGNPVIPQNVDVYPNHTLYVQEPTTLTAPSGMAITNNGAIEAYCTSIKGTVKNTQPVYTHAKLTKWVHNKESHWKECSRCKAKFESEKHKFGSWKTIKKAGWCWSGRRQHTCKVCSYTQNETVAGIKVMELVVKGGQNSITLNWKKVSGADGYMIYGAKCGTKMKYKRTVSNRTLTWTEKKRETGIYYKYYVVAYKIKDGKKVIIGKSSDMHTATLGKGYGYARQITAQNAIALKKGKTAQIKATLVNTNNKVKDHMLRIRFISTNQDVATVTSNGKVTAKGKGSCYIYCYGLNGYTKKVKITVK